VPDRPLSTHKFCGTAEILKLLYLDQRLLILDEPTSVLTPSEADEILGLLKGMAVRKQITVIMITHKFREVTAFADAVTVLRRGRKVGAGNVADVSTDQMARLMIGDTQVRERPGRAERPHAETVLELAALYADDDDGLPALQGAAPRLAARYSEFARFFRSRRVDG
jgi:general nucleoside transport system ATP-binding protein